MPPKTGVKVQLDRQRTLRLGMRALYALEDESGWTIKELLQRLNEGSLKALVLMVWAALLHDDPALTVEQAADLVDQGDINEIAEALNAAAEAQFPADSGNRKAASAKRG